MKKILDLLKNHPEGLTIQKISEILNINRITSTKYIHELMGEGKIYQRKVGIAKLCYAKEKFVEMLNEGKLLKKLKKKIG